MAWPRLWVTTMSVSAGANWRRRASIDSVDIGSSEEVGSSSNSTSGPTARARARHRSCCCPPERRKGESLSLSLTASHSPTSVRRRSAITSSCFPLAMRCALTPATTLSRIDIGKGLGRWNSMPTRRRSMRRSTEWAQRLTSSRVTSPVRWNPGTRSFIRFSVRRKVDLPEPVGPISAVMEPRANATSMSLRIVRASKPRHSLWACMTSAGRAASGSRERSACGIPREGGPGTSGVSLCTPADSFSDTGPPSRMGSHQGPRAGRLERVVHVSVDRTESR